MDDLQQSLPDNIIKTMQTLQSELKKIEDLNGIANKYRDVLIIRYWISTVAAAFVDGIFLLEEALSVALRLYQCMPKPDYIFTFHCDYLSRIERIKKRELLCNQDDDISLVRDKKYRIILEALSKEIQNWYVIDTNNISPATTF